MKATIKKILKNIIANRKIDKLAIICQQKPNIEQHNPDYNRLRTHVLRNVPPNSAIIRVAY